MYTPRVPTHHHHHHHTKGYPTAFKYVYNIRCSVKRVGKSKLVLCNQRCRIWCNRVFDVAKMRVHIHMVFWQQNSVSAMMPYSDTRVEPAVTRQVGEPHPYTRMHARAKVCNLLLTASHDCHVVCVSEISTQEYLSLLK